MAGENVPDLTTHVVGVGPGRQLDSHAFGNYRVTLKLGTRDTRNRKQLIPDRPARPTSHLSPPGSLAFPPL